MKKPRIKTKAVVELSGLSRRTITQHATNKIIPGAVKHGGIWTFDQDLIHKWLREGSNCQAQAPNPKTSTNQTTADIGICVSKSTGSHTESRFAQLLKGSQPRRRKAA